MSTALSYPVLDWPLADMQAALGLSVPAAVVGKAQRIITDSRQVQPGDVFVALRGDRFDAHDFLGDVVARGALAVVVDRAVDVPCLQWQVADTRKALGDLARAWRSRFTLPVIAVTGSNGKTSTKEMIASILRAQCGDAAVLATRGNLNNDVGVPHTLFELTAAHRMAVIEMGMNHPGEIAWLASLVRPTVALVNNAQREHQEFMGTVEAVARENGAVLSALPAQGLAVYPAADEFTPVWDALSAACSALRFATDAPVQINAQGRVEVLSQRDAMVLRLQGPWGAALTVTMQVLGQHNALNALAGALCAWAAGCDATAIARGLEQFRAVQGRMQVVGHPFGGLLINDAYNANPDSVEAAIRTLSAMPAPRCLVLGDMGEVGDQGESFHKELGAMAKAHGIERLHTLGQLARASAAIFGDGAVHHGSVQELNQHLQQEARERPTSILIKGSRFMKMERVVEALLMAAGGTEATHVA
jgi:UDP-N-acetylmuramoyl-tripeptide--D-alanyl-D-alanine ligase